VRRLYRRLQPQLVHHVALQPVIVGSLAALGLPIARLNAIAGFGFSYTSNSPRAVLARTVMTPLMRFLLARPRSAVLVQNGDDRRAVEALGVAADNIFLVPGSGVDADVLTPLPEPQGPVCAAFVGRLLEDKGVRTLVAAHDLLARRGSPVRLLLAGTTDPANPASVTAADVEDWKHRPGLIALGHVVDIASVWAQAHIAVLPSRREGLPKSLLEAAACGRPIVATDVPGCREIAIDGVNALLVPPDDPPALADAIDRLAHDAALRRTFGRASRQLVERQFASEHIGRQIVLVYDRLIGR
jgi:glycosyltransferase involved in cell wall biosynthesis